MKFELDEEQVKKYQAWRKKLKKLPPATIGGGETFCFTPTGLGTAVTVKRVDGEEINLTDYDKW
jgi:hypothetical protein